MNKKTFKVIRYSKEHAQEWNSFVATSKNGTFLFDRRYMDYHSDRFNDHSLMVYHNDRLYALLPANDKGNGILFSHEGLTYGGLIMNDRCRTAPVRDLFVDINTYLRANAFRRVIYKHIPWIYASGAAEEDLFALTNVCHATICARDVASVVTLHRQLPLSQLRRRGVKKAVKAGVTVGEARLLGPFWQLLEENLRQCYNARPVHTLSEIMLLQSRFPENIRLFTASKANELLGGTLLYICGQTVKAQYISANEQGKRLGGLDLLFAHLLNHFATVEKKTYFDFGTSNLPHNDNLNDSLIFQKEGFGGRSICYDTYQWQL